MRFRLTFAPTALQTWTSLPVSVQQQFDEAFDLLEQDPRRTNARVDVHQLYGYRNVWTLRVPPYRGIYVIEDPEVVMVAFGHRDSIYSLLHRMLPPRRQSVSKASLTRRR